MEQEMIGITGVTGHIGRMAAQELKDEGRALRYFARRPERAADLPAESIRRMSYEHTAESVAALSGVNVLFMVSASESPQRMEQHRSLLDAAKEAGVRHVVYTSFYGASPTATFTLARDHAATEEYIKEKGFAYTFLRDNFYLDFFVDLCKEYGEIKGPAGNGKVSAVLRKDVAAVAAEILRDPAKWEGQTLDMTGESAYTMAEIATAVSAAFGKEIPYVEETVAEAYESRKAWEAEQWEYDAWVSTYTAIAAGEQAGVSGDVERVLGRKPKTLATYLSEQ